ncbi:hypothetical protein VNO77_27685 [Canavalia gladiata]|uniref:Uncharacterized protein n=1 Tax=Canavalia gladiata TaxID=3824 RepID=A0AAN9KV44_CANGL
MGLLSSVIQSLYRALRVTIVKEEKTNVVKVSDWMPEYEAAGVLTRRHLPSLNDSQKQLMSITDREFHINFDLAELGISVVDHTATESCIRNGLYPEMFHYNAVKWIIGSLCLPIYWPSWAKSSIQSINGYVTKSKPRGVLGSWASLITALGNAENMPVRINQRFNEKGQPLQLLSSVDILGNASSALGHMSKEEGGALAKGLFRGVTGILTKPFEGEKSSGVEGFVQGVGKGIIGAAAQPVRRVA